jgi:hypothetical protein
MSTNPNDDEATATLMRTSVQMPLWMWRWLGEKAERTYSSRAQVVRRLLAEAHEREASEAVAS